MAAVREPAPEPTLRRSIGRGAVWAALSNIVMRLGSLAVTAVVARILAPDEFGVFAVALAVFVVVTSLAELGMASAVARSPMEPSDIAGTVTSISVLVSLALAALMAVFASPLAVLLGVPDAAGPVRVLAISLALTGLFAVPGAQLVREFRQDRIFVATVAGFVPANVVLVVMALAGHGATSFAWSRVVGQLVTGLVFVAFLKHRYRPQWRPELVGPLLRFGLPLSLANLINWTLLNADYLVIGRLLSEAQVGVYMIAFTVASWSTAVLGSVLNGVVVPAFGRVQGDVAAMRAALVTAVRLVALVALPIAATTMALAPSLVRTVFGPAWADAAPVLVVLAAYGATFAFTLLFVNVLVAAGATRNLLLVQVAWVVALVVAMVAGVEVGGLVGAAWAHVVVVLAVAMPAYLLAVRAELGSVPAGMLGAVVGPALAAAGAAGAALLVDLALPSPTASFLVGGVVAVAVYVVLAGPMLLESLPEVAARAPSWLVRRRPGTGTETGPETGPVRVAFVLEGLALGGCPINTVDLARSMRGRGHEVHLLAVDEDVAVPVLPYARAAGFEVTVLPRQAGLLGRARQLHAYADAHEVQVLHVCAPWLGRAAVLAAALRPRRAAVVLNWMMANEFPVTPRTPLVVGTAGLHAEALAVHGPRSYLLEPPVDLGHDRPDPAAAAAFREAYGLAPDDRLLVLVGRVDRVMKLPGILTAVEALERIPDPRVRLVVVGDGNAADTVREHARAANERLGREAVVLTGQLDDPHPAYAAADVGLAMGGSALRVLAHDRPLVVLGENGYSQWFGPAHVEEFTGAGFWGTTPQADPAGHLAAQVVDLLGGRLDTGAEGWARGWVRDRYGLERATDVLLRVHREALDQRPSRWVRLGDAALLAVREGLGRVRRAVPRRDPEAA